MQRAYLGQKNSHRIIKISQATLACGGWEVRTPSLPRPATPMLSHLWQCLLIAVDGIVYQVSDSAATISTRDHDPNVTKTHRHLHRLGFFRWPTGIQLAPAEQTKHITNSKVALLSRGPVRLTTADPEMHTACMLVQLGTLCYTRHTKRHTPRVTRQSITNGFKQADRPSSTQVRPPASVTH